MEKSNITQQLKNSVINEYNEGHTVISSLSKKFNISDFNVKNILKEKGLYSRKFYRDVLSDEKVQEVIEKYKTGSFTQPELAEFFSVNIGVIARITQKHKIVTERTKEFLTAEQKEEIVKFYQTGEYSISQVAQIAGATYAQVRFYFNKQGIVYTKGKSPNEVKMVKDIENAFKSGEHTRSSLAKRYNLRIDRINTILEDAGIEFTKGLEKRERKIKPVKIKEPKPKKESLPIKKKSQKTNAADKLNESELKKIIEEYTINLVSIKNLAASFNIGPASIRNFFKDNNIEIRGDSLTEQHKTYILNLYSGSLENPIDTEFLSQSLGVKRCLINDFLRESGIKNKDVIKPAYRKYPLNEHYFDIIDTPDSAYFFGIFSGDGYHEVESYTMKLKLKEIDKYILERLNLLVGSTRPLYFEKKAQETWSNTYSLFMNSKHMSQQLSEKGICGDKTIQLEFPTCVPDHLMSHYVRGFFDADGCIKALGNYINFCATKKWCDGLNELTNRLFDINFSMRLCNPKVENDVYSIDFSGRKQVAKFCEWMYQDKGDLFLERKYQRYADMLNYVPKCNGKPKLMNPDGTPFTPAQKKARQAQQKKDAIALKKLQALEPPSSPVSEGPELS